MQPFLVPSIFTATDQYSSTLDKMANSTQRFNSKVESLHAKSTKAFNAITPSISEAGKQLLSYAGTAAVAAGIIGTAKFSVDSLMKYETEIANLSAITGTSGSALDVFKIKINDVAKATKESAINVAKAFTQIGNNSPKLLEDADGLAEVTKQSIILAQASKMELAPAADYLTKIMNQFNVPAKDAAKTIDLLAGGMVIGSTDIDKVSEAMLVFGGAAGQAGIGINESVTAIEAISDKVTDMSRLGTQFRNIFSRMEHASVLDKTATKALKEAGVNVGILESKATPLVEKLKELQKLQKVKGGMVAVFNEENMQSLIPLLNKIPVYESMLKKLNEETEKGGIAQAMANKNNDTFAKKIEQLKNGWVNLLVSSEGARNGIDMIKSATDFLITNMGTIITVTKWVVGVMLAWKAINISMNAIILISNIRLGISNALKLESIALLEGNVLATRVSIITEKLWAASMWISNLATTAWTAVMGYATSAQIALNVAMTANPIGLIVVAVAALAAGIGYLIYQNQMLTAEYKKNVADKTIKELNTETESVNKLAARYEKLGMSKEVAFQKALSFEKKEVGRQRIEVEAKLKTMPYNDERVAQESLAKDLAIQNQALTQIEYDTKMPAINPKMAQQTALANTVSTNINNANATLTIHNDSNNPASLEGGGSTNSILPNTSSTTKMK